MNQSNDVRHGPTLPRQYVAALPTSMDLYTIPFSHFCEKARWGLAYYGIPYKEHRYLPLLHMLPMLWQSWGKGKFDRHSTPASTPMLRTDNDEYLCDSGLILSYLTSRFGRSSLHLYPTPEARELEHHFSNTLGPDARRVAYFHVLQEKELALAICSSSVGPIQPAILNAIYGLWYAGMRKALNIHEGRAARSLQDVELCFDLVEERLSDGRAFLCGRRFSAADLSFSALAVPVIWPSLAEGLGTDMTPWEQLPEPLLGIVRRFRERPAGQFALRMFREHKPQLHWV